MTPQLSMIVPIRNRESVVAEIARKAEQVVQILELPRFELLMMDEQSSDNTLSVLSLLRERLPHVRVFQDVEPGHGIAQAVHWADAPIWLVLDHLAEPELALWAVRQIRAGYDAAIVPGQLLSVNRETGGRALRDLRGGLVSAGRAVERYVSEHGLTLLKSPPTYKNPLERAHFYVRKHLSRLGFTQADRPLL